MSVSQNYPIVSPSLNLDFANTKKLDPRVTFARASTATYYDGKTVAKAEENLLLRSQEFNLLWNGAGFTATPDVTTAPDGTTTADLINEGTTTGFHYANSSSGTALNTAGTYTLSMYAKNIDAQYLNLILFTGSGGFASVVFDLINVTTSNASLGAYTVNNATITALADGWYRCSMTATIPTANNFASFALSNTATAGYVASYTGTNRTLYLWGAQLEQRSSVTAYTPTTTQPITNYIPTLLTAPANVARFEHSPTTSESLGLLVEEQRTNLVTYSEDLSDASWVKNNVTITSNTIVAPDGTLTGDKLVETTSNSTHYISKASSFGLTTISVYLKAAERSIVYLYAYPSDPYYATINLATATISGNGYYSSSSITSVGNGWYRVSIYNNAGWGGPLWLALTNGTTNSYTGNGYSGVYVWGFQAEVGAFPTSYIKTVASQVTRAADSASMVGANFSEWYRADEGTLYAEASPLDFTSTNLQNGFALYASSSTQNFISFSFDNRDGGKIGASVFSSNVTQVSLIENNKGLGENKAAFAYKTNDFAVSSNGSAALTDSLGVVPVVSSLEIGKYPPTTPDFFANNTIKKISYYPARLTNTQLQALTS